MAVCNAGIDVRPVYNYFVEHICFLKELYWALQPQPEWLPLVEYLTTIENFWPDISQEGRWLYRKPGRKMALPY